MSLYAYSAIADKHFKERFGLDFEDFKVGQRFRHRPGLTLSQQDNVDEALDTQNAAMIHYDANYAAQTTWKKELMVSTLTLQRLIGLSSKTFGRKHSIQGFKEISMTRPVFGGDTVYAESEVLAVGDSQDAELGELLVRCHGFKQDKEEFARITYRVLVYRRGAHPDDIAIKRSATEQERFLAHRTEVDGVLTEQVGLFFEDCNSGDAFTHWPRRSILRDESLQHTWRSMELSPQYHDLDWIERHGASSARISETWIIGIVTAMTTRTFGRVVANLGWTDIEFAARVHAGDTLEARSTILDKRESKSRPNEGILHVETRAFNQRDEQVLSYQRKLLVYRREATTPYAAAGY